MDILNILIFDLIFEIFKINFDQFFIKIMCLFLNIKYD